MPLLKFTIIKFLDVDFNFFYLAVSIACATLTGNKITRYQPGLLRAYFADCCVVHAIARRNKCDDARVNLRGTHHGNDSRIKQTDVQ